MMNNFPFMNRKERVAFAFIFIVTCFPFFMFCIIRYFLAKIIGLLPSNNNNNDS